MDAVVLVTGKRGDFRTNKNCIFRFVASLIAKSSSFRALLLPFTPDDDLITVSALANKFGGIVSQFWIFDFKAADHRMTRSALAKTLGGMVTPICLAALRLITNSNLIGRSTGRSAGLAPFKILST
jgi:hypothetical protein